jgi:hypothetical protein
MIQIECLSVLFPSCREVRLQGEVVRIHNEHLRLLGNLSHHQMHHGPKRAAFSSLVWSQRNLRLT